MRPQPAIAGVVQGVGHLRQRVDAVAPRRVRSAAARLCSRSRSQFRSRMWRRRRFEDRRGLAASDASPAATATGDGSQKSLVLMGGPAPFGASGPRTQECDTAHRRVFLRRLVRRPRRVSRHLARQPFGTRRAARCPVSRARQGSLPVTRDTSRHDLTVAETPECSPAARLPAPLGSQAVGGASPSARYREHDARCLCDASTAYCCAVAAEAHGAPCGALLTTPDPPVRQRHLEAAT